MNEDPKDFRLHAYFLGHTKRLMRVKLLVSQACGEVRPSRPTFCDPKSTNKHTGPTFARTFAKF